MLLFSPQLVSRLASVSSMFILFIHFLILFSYVSHCASHIFSWNFTQYLSNLVGFFAQFVSALKYRLVFHFFIHSFLDISKFTPYLFALNVLSWVFSSSFTSFWFSHQVSLLFLILSIFLSLLNHGLFLHYSPPSFHFFPNNIPSLHLVFSFHSIGTSVLTFHILFFSLVQSSDALSSFSSVLGVFFILFLLLLESFRPCEPIST
jgi:hypothetical protein